VGAPSIGNYLSSSARSVTVEDNLPELWPIALFAVGVAAWTYHETFD